MGCRVGMAWVIMFPLYNKLAALAESVRSTHPNRRLATAGLFRWRSGEMGWRWRWRDVVKRCAFLTPA